MGTEVPAQVGRPSEVVLGIRNLNKRFGGVHALDSFDLDLYGGEIHGLLGQNGSGKSTLIKILAGYYAPEAGGSCTIDGEAVALPLRHPEEHGLAVIHQDLGLIDSLSVMDNLGIGVRYGHRGLGLCNWKSERRECSKLLDEFQLDIDPEALTGEISQSARAIVAVARAVRTLRSEAHVNGFLLDEPTAYMPATESARVMTLMRSVASMGAAVVFVGHRLEELLAVTDRITVLRDGRKVGTVSNGSGVRDQLLEMMLGQVVKKEVAGSPCTGTGVSEQDVALRVESLSGRVAENVSFVARKGEIVGLTGLVGMGHEEVPYLIAGAVPVRGGCATASRGRAVGQSPGKSFREGVVLVPGDRRREGIWLDATATENITLPNLKRYFVGWLRRNREYQRANALMKEFHVRPPDAGMRLTQFSGSGNQQKILLAKWLQGEPAVLLLAEPTQGVDVGARHEVHQIVRENCSARRGSGRPIFRPRGTYGSSAHVS